MQKGLDLLLQAFDKMDEKKASLVIAGDGQATEIEWLKQAISSLRHSNNVSFVGPVKGKDKAALLQQAGCLVLPSRYETQPLVVLEAFANRCPVIVTNISGLSWIPDSCAWKVSAEINDLAKKMQQVFRKPSVLQQKAERALEFVQSFGLERIAGAYADVIKLHGGLERRVM